MWNVKSGWTNMETKNSLTLINSCYYKNLEAKRFPGFSYIG